MFTVSAFPLGFNHADAKMVATRFSNEISVKSIRVCPEAIVWVTFVDVRLKEYYERHESVENHLSCDLARS